MTKYLIIAIILLTFSQTAFAKVYKWTDAQGKVYYSDKPVEDEKIQELKLQTTKQDPVEAARLRAQTQKIRQKTRSYSQKSSSSYSNSSRNSADYSEKDKARCKKYQDRYAQYQRDGVEGYNPVTGKRGKMTGADKHQALDNVRASIDVFCH